MKRLFLIATLCGAALPALAQSVVGVAVVNGKKVELLDNNTWRYKLAQFDADCPVLELDVSFCHSATSWKTTKNTNPDASAMYRWSDRTYGMFIIEGVGASQGINPDYMVETVLSYPAAEQGIDASQVPVLGLEDVTVDEVDGQTLVYSAVLNSIPVIFMNSILIQDTRTVQIVSFSLSDRVTEEQTIAHQALVENSKL